MMQHMASEDYHAWQKSVWEKRGRYPEWTDISNLFHQCGYIAPERPRIYEALDEIFRRVGADGGQSEQV
jgi:hypothetical protein